jgi:hypothetical protein
MRETARPEVKRRRRFKPAAVTPVTAAPEPRVVDKYYAEEITCRMVELGIEVPGCKGKFKPRGNRVTCSSGCADALDRYHNKKSAKKNYPKHRDKILAAQRAQYVPAAVAKGKPPARHCLGPADPKTTAGPRCGKEYYSWQPAEKFCSDSCFYNHRNEVNRQRRQERPQPTKDKTCRAPHPTIPGKLCGKKFTAVGNNIGRHVYCSDDCRHRVRLITWRKNNTKRRKG